MIEFKEQQDFDTFVTDHGFKFWPEAKVTMPPAFTSLGGYPIVYLCVDDEALCWFCVNEHGHANDDEDPSFRLAGADVYWEGLPLICVHCGDEIESAYGDPEAKEEED